MKSSVGASFVWSFWLVACLASEALAAPRVAGFERFHAAGPEPRAAGRLLWNELHCGACHQAAPGTATSAKPAPVLDAVSGRVKPSWLRQFLTDPAAAKPGTTMPALFAELPEAERRTRVEALVHYLVSLGPGEPVQEFPTTGAASMGRRLYHQVGCVACHGARSDKEPQPAPLATSVPWPNLHDKYTLASLTTFLLDPLAVRHGGRMPRLGLSGQEARLIASFLLAGLPEVSNVQFSYYEGSWNQLPDFSKLTPKAIGGTTRIDVSPKQRGDQFGLRFEGFLRIDAEGEYTFHLSSDDGSRLSVDGKVVVDHDGIHGTSSKSGKVRLAPGYHAVLVDFFEQGGGEELSAEFEGPGTKRTPLGPVMATSKEPPQRESLGLTLDPALVDKGRALFASSGCAACHVVREKNAVVENRLTAKPLTALAAGGCLDGRAGGPNFGLAAPQRTALAEVVREKSELSRPLAPAESIAATMTAFNCYACHARSGVGGVEEARNEAFAGTTPEMGDEGRLPPALDGAGAKLTAEWLRKILADGAKDRPYMLARMPSFGAANVGHLEAAFAAADPPVAAPAVSFAVPAGQVKGAGRHLVGDKAFSCIKCHSFGRFQATGIQSIDLSIMTRRLREDWFRTYVRNPQVYRRGTRMPQAWPAPESLLPAVLDGQSETQIAAVWQYLLDGDKARIPDGLAPVTMELIPVNEALLYRNFIEGAGPRAIGVGYPENVHAAFDANQLRLALLWQGRFIDASRHWSGRGEGFQGPAGDNVLKLPDGPSFAVLDSPDQPWPNQPAKSLGLRFVGYRLSDDQRPTFLYTLGGTSFEDYLDTTINDQRTPLRRVLTAKGDDRRNLWYRAAIGAKIAAGADGWYDLGAWKTRIEGATPVLRRSGSNDELLVPVSSPGAAAKFVQHYLW